MGNTDHESGSTFDYLTLLKFGHRPLAQGLALEADVVQKSLKFMDGVAPHIKASIQLDVEAGRKSKIEAMIGVIRRRGYELGVSTSAADFIYAALLPIDLKARRAG